MIWILYAWFIMGAIATLIVLIQEYDYIKREKVGYSVTGAILMTCLGFFSLYGVYLEWRAKKSGLPLKFYVKQHVVVCMGDYEDQEIVKAEILNTEYISRSYLIKYLKNNQIFKAWVHEEKITSL